MPRKKRLHLPPLDVLRRAWTQLTEREWRFVSRRGHLQPYNRVLPLRTGKEAFPAMLAAIRAAQRYILFETYILRADRTGTEFQQALVERARAGVQVRLICDALGSIGLPGGFLSDLEKAGVLVRQYHPIVPWRARWNLNQRDHQKILVVDGRIGFTGGLNFGDEYRPVEEGGAGWFDMHASVQGPAVLDLERFFRRTWVKAGGEAFVDAGPPAAAAGGRRGDAAELSGDAAVRSGDAAVQVISNVGVRSRWQMHRAYIHAIRRAQGTISIMNAYFIPDRRLRRAFARASRRGVAVNVIVPSAETDVKAVYYASRHLYEHLMRRGVRIFEWPERMMHAKLGVIDGVWSTIGSYNLDRRSLLHNLEISLVIVDRNIGAELQTRFESDLTTCHEILPEQWRRRSPIEKALEWLFYQVRYWL